MQKSCAAFEAPGSSFAAQLPTFKWCKVAALMLQFSCGRSDGPQLSHAPNMNCLKSLATDYGFNLKWESFDWNVSKLVRREDHLLNKPPKSVLSINFIPSLASVGMLSLIPWRHSRPYSNWSALWHASLDKHLWPLNERCKHSLVLCI